MVISGQDIIRVAVRLGGCQAPRFLLQAEPCPYNVTGVMAREESGRFDIASGFVTPCLLREGLVLIRTDTGEPVFLPFRMSYFIFSNSVVTAGMLTPGLKVRDDPCL